MLRRILPVATLILALPARSQGVPDLRTGVVLPNAQGAAVEDATALSVNPAGLALIEGLELNLGGFTRSLAGLRRTDLDLTIATRAFGPFALGLGGGLTLADETDPRWRTSVGIGLGGRTASAGVGFHRLSALTGAGEDAWSADVGTQLRPARWLGLAFALEQLGAGSARAASGRLGVSVRPLNEALTVGVDARLVPGSTNPIEASYWQGLTMVPAAVARLEVGGLAVTAGASVGNVGPGARGDPTLEIMASLELNGASTGATFLGGGSDLLAPGDAAGLALGGARLRASTASWPSFTPERGRWLALAIEGEGTLERERRRSFVAGLFADEPDALAVLLALHNAADDASVEGVLIHTEALSLGWGRLAELRAALTRLRAAGKKVIVHMDGGDDGDVYVASAADRVYLTPSGSLDMNGLRAERLYFGDLLAKIGVETEAVAAGRYKSAPRQFTSNEPSPEETEVEAALLDGAFTALTSMVAEGRGLQEDEVRQLIDRGGLTAAEAQEARLVDGLAYSDELKARVEEVAGHPVRLETRFIDKEKRSVRWDDSPRIALIPIEGTIAMEGGFSLLGGDTASAVDVVAAVRQAANDDSVRAIVLRIDSPGGDALASDLMWHAVMEARAKKPVVASMGDIAASGGYYVAAAAHTIYAEPNTITGSIGVFGLLANIEDLADRIGLRAYRTDRGALTGPSLYEPLSDAQRAALQRSVDASYERFLTAVLTGRAEHSGLDENGLRTAAEGRVWTGTQARERKLVDEVGGFVDALEDARRRAQIDDDQDITLEVLIGGSGGLERLAGVGRALAPGGLDGMERVARLLLGDPAALGVALTHTRRPLALMPVRVRVR